jgi:hypothetical protein
MNGTAFAYDDANEDEDEDEGKGEEEPRGKKARSESSAPAEGADPTSQPETEGEGEGEGDVEGGSQGTLGGTQTSEASEDEDRTQPQHSRYSQGFVGMASQSSYSSSP